MKTIQTKNIIAFDEKYLISVIQLWNEYDTMSVLVAYSELKRRKCDIPIHILEEMIDFFVKKNILI
jgi:hypothetical protein